MNVINISQGLQSIKEQVDKASDIAHFELVNINQIKCADDNPYASNDTDESTENLAESIRLNGLLHPITVNKIEGVYHIISGERRYSAIKEHLKWNTIPCMVYDNISQDEAQLRLHSANLEVRDYTAGQKLLFYEQVEELVQKMIDSGKYSGGKQKCIANILGISERQARKYKQISENLSEEKKEEIKEGKLSIREAYNEIKIESNKPEPVPVKSSKREKEESVPVRNSEEEKGEPVPVSNSKQEYTLKKVLEYIDKETKKVKTKKAKLDRDEYFYLDCLSLVLEDISLDKEIKDNILGCFMDKIS